MYALVAVGYSMVYSILYLINFAHGDLFIFGTFLAFAFFNMGMPLVGAMIIGAILCGIIAMGIERVVYRPVRNASRIVPMVGALGAALILRTVAQVCWGASPSPDRILEGIKAADSGSGVLLIVKNYSGDVMNFQMAAELAELEDIRTEQVIVKDDVAVADSTFSTGRRGIAGTVFVHKIAGAAAETGAPLEEIKRVAEKVIANVRTMGMAMTPCILPGVGKAGFTLADDEVEIGMGIHGEPGINREKISSAEDIAKKLTGKILEDIDYSESEVAVLVNGLGGTPLMELYVMFNEVEKILSSKGIQVYKSFVGNYMTSLEMAGCSITLLKLDEELKVLLDAPADAPAFKC